MASTTSWTFAAVCGVILLLTLIVHARTSRDVVALSLAGTTRSEAAPLESFNEPAYIVAQRVKSRAYARAGLRFFYSDGTLPESTVPTHLYLLPTTHDISCSLGDAARRAEGCAPRNSHIATLAARESRTSVGGAGSSATCAAAFPTASRLASPADSGLRVLEGRYDMTTACAVVRGRFATTSDARVVSLVLTKPAMPETRALLLMRPTFLATATSRLYAVDLTGLDFDSARTSRSVTVRLVEVPATAPQVSDPPSAAPALTTIRETDLRLTLYYPSYSGLYPGAQAPTTRQLSMYLTISPDILARASAPSWGTTSGDRLRLTVNPASAGALEGHRRVSVQAGARRSDLPAIPGARVIVTRATNSLIVACLTPTRTILRVIGGLPAFDVQRSDTAAAAAALPVFTTSPSLPYTSHCIPHLAHIADALGLLR